MRFLRGKAYEGRDYMPGDVAEVAEPWARRFLLSGSAVLVEGEEPPPPPGPLGTDDQAAVLANRRRRGA